MEELRGTVVRVGDGGAQDGLVLSGGCFVSDGSRDGPGGDAQLPPCFWGVSAQAGRVARFEAEAEALGGRPEETLATRGCPLGVAVDGAGRLFVADVEHGAVLRLEPTGVLSPVVSEYEGKALLGPSSVALGADGTVFFTDSGPLGESSLDSPRGAVFSIEHEAGGGGLVLRPLSRGLAHPCGVCVGEDGSVYVAEMLANRVLRLARRPNGTYLVSVLHCFSGRLGPSALAYSRGRLFCARYDLAGQALITELDLSGLRAPRDLLLPDAGGAQITAIALHEDNNALFCFEASSGKVTLCKLPPRR